LAPAPPIALRTRESASCGLSAAPTSASTSASERRRTSRTTSAKFRSGLSQAEASSTLLPPPARARRPTLAAGSLAPAPILADAPLGQSGGGGWRPLTRSSGNRGQWQRGATSSPRSTEETWSSTAPAGGGGGAALSAAAVSAAAAASAAELASALFASAESENLTSAAAGPSPGLDPGN